MRGQQRLGDIQPRELREEFRRRVAHRRVSRDPQLFFTVADLRRGTAAIAGEREVVDQRSIGRVDRDVVADGHRAINAAGFLGIRERELLDARLEDGHEAGLEARRIDAVEDFCVRELGLEDLFDQVFVRGSEIRFVIDAGARFLVRVVAGFGRHHHADLGRRRHDQRPGQVAFRPHRHFRAAAEHQQAGGESKRCIYAVHAVTGVNY